MPKSKENLDIPYKYSKTIIIDETTEDSDEQIEAPVQTSKPIKERVYKELKPDDKRKKGLHIRTEAQQKGWEKAVKVREENRKKRLEDKQKMEEEHKKKMEEIVVKKAISVKKKQIKKQAVLDEISDDETPIEDVKKIVKKSKPITNYNYEQPKQSLSFQFI